LQSKFSIYHSAAVAFIDKDAGIAQYTNEKARDADVVALRRKVEVVSDAGLRNDEARASVLLRDGRAFEVHVPHASGTFANPMSDAALQGKCIANASPVIGADRARAFAALCWNIEDMTDTRELIAALA
jgi:2-methylcitrate dehydratase PrpD